MKLEILIIFLLFTVKKVKCQENSLKLPNLPVEHIVRFLNSLRRLEAEYIDYSIGRVYTYNKSEPCWGFELGCKQQDRFQAPECVRTHAGDPQDEYSELFFKQADFGYVEQFYYDTAMVCEANLHTDSYLECAEYLRHCRGRKLLFDFRDLLQRQELIRYHLDVLKPKQILGHCIYNDSMIAEGSPFNGALQSWSSEIKNFAEYSQGPIMESGLCDIIETKPTFIMKVDATYNMYHHFCDFFNLYVTLFANQTHELAFDTDVRILIWETYPYDSPFAVTFKAFTKNPIWTLNEVKGKRVCFSNVMMSLMPRMIYGLFYNTPLSSGCRGSGLFRAFSEFILHRLQIPFDPPVKNQTLRITFLLRRTRYRNVRNERALIAALKQDENYRVRSVSYEKLKFKEQLKITRNTDIFIGMHGAGLTHLLFLPEWATVFELYNCEDPNCYKDLARLKGINYLTWENKDLLYPEDEGHHPQIGAHAKFTNYAFNETEFLRLVTIAAEDVRANPIFQNYVNAETKDEL